jgi:hypothetical protein
MDLPSLSRIVDVSESGDAMVMLVYSDVGMISLSQRQGVTGIPRYWLSWTLPAKAQAWEPKKMWRCALSTGPAHIPYEGDEGKPPRNSCTSYSINPSSPSTESAMVSYKLH